MATVQKLMQVLGVSEEEAREILATDKAIEQGADPFPLTEAEEKASKEARRAEQDKATRKQTAKAKKVDAEKLEIMQVIDDALCDLVDNVEVINPGRELVCHFNGRKFKITLSAPRS
jgi:membrane protein involved in colicin uptake